MQVLRSVRAVAHAPRGVGRAGLAAQRERRGERDHDAGCAAGGHGHDLPIAQSTLVSSFALIVTFSVFLPSSPCQISTS